MASSAVLSSKGQIVIPAKLRKELNLKPGARVNFKRQGKTLVLESNPFDELRALRGKFAGLPLLEDLAELRREWDERLESM